MNFPDSAETSTFDSCDRCGCIPCACEDIADTAPDVDGCVECPACGGDANLLGLLGSRAHYRCRGCGLDCSRTIGGE